MLRVRAVGEEAGWRLSELSERQGTRERERWRERQQKGRTRVEVLAPTSYDSLLRITMRLGGACNHTRHYGQETESPALENMHKTKMSDITTAFH